MSEVTKSDAVLGTLVTHNKDWVDRAGDLCDPDLWEVEVRPTPKLLGQLTGSEITRLEPKLEIVKEAARYQAAGMLKGTIKYPNDNYDLDTWMAHLMGEGADFLNYIGLTLRARREEKH